MNNPHHQLETEIPSCAVHNQKKKLNNIPLTQDHSLITCIYNAETQSSGTLFQSTAVVGFRRLDGNVGSLNLHAIQRALAPTKTAALAAVPCLKCANCDSDATNSCSSIIASQESTGPDEKSIVLTFTERIICSCNDENCLSQARKKRNEGRPIRKWGCGFQLTFRCAIEPLSNILSKLINTEKRSPSASKCNVHKHKENASENILTSRENEPATKKIRFE